MITFKIREKSLSITHTNYGTIEARLYNEEGELIGETVVDSWVLDSRLEDNKLIIKSISGSDSVLYPTKIVRPHG